jgi:hypothetical protein
MPRIGVEAMPHEERGIQSGLVMGLTQIEPKGAEVLVEAQV